MRLNILAPVLVAGLCFSSAAFAADVAVEISGVRAANGPLYVSLQTREQFKQRTGTAGTILQDPAVGVVKVTLPGVAAGEYAISIWHDIDGDGQFDFGPDGRPADGWSMVNAAALRGDPAFDEVKFAVPAAGASIALTMIYAE